MNRIIPLLIGLILLSTISSCGESKAEKEKRIEKESIEAENAKAEAAKQELEMSSFTTSSGRYNTEKALQDSYNQGVKNYNTFGAYNPKLGYALNPNVKNEERFKQIFTTWFGIPTNEKAKEVYKRAYKKYVEGWNDAANF